MNTASHMSSPFTGFQLRLFYQFKSENNAAHICLCVKYDCETLANL